MQAPPKKRGFLRQAAWSGQTVSIASKNRKHSMRKQYYISIHQRCPLGFWHSLPQAVALQTISNDSFTVRMEKVYPYQRPSYAHT